VKSSSSVHAQLLAISVSIVCGAGALLAGQSATKPNSRSDASPPIVFTNVTTAAGIAFTHVNGAFGKKYLPETMGSGVAFLDFDGDGSQDLFFVNGKHWAGAPASRASNASSTLPALYRNNLNGTFTDVTKQAGLAVEMYGFGAAAADFDNDGHVDLFVTALDRNHLFRNTRRGTFVDVTAKAGVGPSAFSTSAAWVDYDKDGWLDLVVLNYVEWSIAQDRFCSLDGKTKSYCTPEAYKGVSPMLYRNLRDGTFQDVTRAAGLHDPMSKALGIALVDYNKDGWLDLFVANDTQPNRLYRNNGASKSGGVTFTDDAVAAGVAFNEAGVARAGMGVDAADYDDSGRESLVIGNFSNEMMALYHNEGSNLFIDEAPAGTIGRVSQLSLTFSCFFFDYDLDGRPDIFAANGHVLDDINRAQPKITYPQAPHLFRNAGGKRFDVAKAGAALDEKLVARGAAYGDYDLDGDLDLVIATNNGAPRLLRNDGGNRAHALRLTLVGTKSNRSAIGARAIVTVDKAITRRAMVKTGSSYLSQSELPLTFGLGQATSVSGIEIRWPSGHVDKLLAVDADQQLTIQEGRGIVSRAPLEKKPPGARSGPASR
jgi:enediyne biosynthesis protein E4